MNSSSIKTIFFYWFPLFVYCSIIFYLSSKTVIHVSHDKMAHTIEYAGLGFLIARLLFHSYPKKIKWMILLAPILGALYGVSDEFHQSFVPGRDSSGWDVLADFFGSSLGVLVYVAIHRLQRLIPQNS